MYIKVDRDADKALYAQIRDALRDAIDKKELKPGDQLPTVAAFAKGVGVTQATIRRAYEDLTKQGIVGCHVGRGSFVKAPEEEETEPQDVVERHENNDMKIHGNEPKLAARRLKMGISKNLYDLMALTRKPGLIHFTSGLPDASILKEGLLDELAQDSLEQDQAVYRAYSEPLGLIELRELIAERYHRRGLKITPDQILVTNGSRQAIALLAHEALEREGRIICETPCYTGLADSFECFGHWIESVPRDWDGPLPERLNRFTGPGPTYFYLCPELHNPMGIDISPERRTDVLNWTVKNDSVLIADEIFHDLRYEGESPHSLMNDLEAEKIAVVSSLSKSFMCGLRIGWLVSSRERIRSLARIKKAMDGGCPPLMQGLVVSLLKSGRYDEHLVVAGKHYRMRRDAVLAALNNYMPEEITWTEPKGGFHMWLELPERYSSIVLFLKAIEQGVSILPGPRMDIDHRYVNCIRLSFGSLDVGDIKEGVELLAAAVRDLLEAPPNDHGLSGLGDFL